MRPEPLNKEVLKDPNAIEKYLCQPLQDEINKNNLRRLDDTEIKTMIHFLLGQIDIQGLVNDFSQKSIVIPALKKRQEVIFGNKLIDDETCIMILIITNGNIGTSLMYLYFIQWYCHKNEIKNYSFKEDFANIFPMGVFKEETLEHFWDATKVDNEHSLVNLIDVTACGASFIKMVHHS